MELIDDNDSDIGPQDQDQEGDDRPLEEESNVPST